MPYSVSGQTIRHEIAMSAARLIAEHGMDYRSAKRKAAHDVFGNRRVQGDWLPDNHAIEDEVRAYQELFQADTQPKRLKSLRRTAAELMKFLAEFRPYLTGALVNGTAGEHSDIHLQLFVDSPKDVEVFLLNHGISFDAHETPRTLAGAGRVESLSFVWPQGRERARAAQSDGEYAQPEGVHLTLYEVDALRGALAGERGRARTDLAGLERLLAENADSAPASSTIQQLEGRS